MLFAVNDDCYEFSFEAKKRKLMLIVVLIKPSRIMKRTKINDNIDVDQDDDKKSSLV